MTTSSDKGVLSKKIATGPLSITKWVQQQLKPYVAEASCCVDATAGKGKDTLFLCENMKLPGMIYAFDIQKEALNAAKQLLMEFGYRPEIYEKDHCKKKCTPNSHTIQLILDGHEHMNQYMVPNSVDVMMFNLGYLPGGDHALATKPETTIGAIEMGLDLLKVGGVMSICIYSGGDSGFAERDAVLPFLEMLDTKKYTVIVSRFYNKPNHPPIPVFIRKDR